MKFCSTHVVHYWIGTKEIHILIIDDDKDDHFFFTNALACLEQGGFFPGIKIKITAVLNGIQGIDFLLKRNSFKNSTDSKPAFIVLDLHMPIMDGHETLKEIKNHPALTKIPVYVLTSSERENRAQCVAGGCSGFFSKPPDVEELQAVIKKMFEFEIKVEDSNV